MQEPAQRNRKEKEEEGLALAGAEAWACACGAYRNTNTNDESTAFGSEFNRLLLIELTQKHTNHFITHTLRLSLSRFSGNKQSIHLFILEIPHFVSTSYSNLYCFHCPKQKQSLYFGQPCSIDVDAFTKILIATAATLFISNGARTAPDVAFPASCYFPLIILCTCFCRCWGCSGRWCSGW